MGELGFEAETPCPRHTYNTAKFLFLLGNAFQDDLVLLDLGFGDSTPRTHSLRCYSGTKDSRHRGDMTAAHSKNTASLTERSDLLSNSQSTGSSMATWKVQRKKRRPGCSPVNRGDEITEEWISESSA
jgi:hypothetical protein